jgi:hypothetical protein
MPQGKAFAAVTLAVALISGCGSANSVSRLPDGDYLFRSKRGNFTCVAPSFARSGKPSVETYEGDNTFVEFSGAYGELLRIECSPIPPEYAARVAVTDRHTLLDGMFDRVLMPAEFLRASPSAHVVRREYVDTAAGAALFCVVEIPGGSTLAESVNGSPYSRPDSTRGVLLFITHGYAYTLGNQELREPFKDSQDRLLDDLNGVVAKMTFQG